jgi:two-component SAPR family response regulator
VEAFSMHASGYILKPVTAEAIAEAMEQLRHPVNPLPEKRLRVQTFGNFEVLLDEKPLTFARSKTKELFAYLVSRRGAHCGVNAELDGLSTAVKLYFVFFSFFLLANALTL